jgi:hypothetical protein
LKDAFVLIESRLESEFSYQQCIGSETEEVAIRCCHDVRLRLPVRTCAHIVGLSSSRKTRGAEWQYTYHLFKQPVAIRYMLLKRIYAAVECICQANVVQHAMKIEYMNPGLVFQI